MTTDEGEGAAAPVRPIYIGPWRVDVTLRDGVGPGPLPASRAALARAVGRALDAAGAPSPGSVGLILSDNAELADLNEAHMGHEGPTDVLSFPMLPPEAYPPHPGSATAGPKTAGSKAAGAWKSGEPASARPAFVLPDGVRTHVGDIIVSVERAIEQAVEGRGGQTGDVRWSPGDELRLLVTHGTLHLCGWDHADPVEGDAMRALERQLLAAR